MRSLDVLKVMNKTIFTAIALFTSIEAFALFRFITITQGNSSEYGIALTVTQTGDTYTDYVLNLKLPERDFSEPLAIELTVIDEEGVLVSKTNWGYLVETGDPNSFGRAIDGFSFRVRNDLITNSILKLLWLESAEMTINLKDFPVRKESENQSSQTTPASAAP